MYDPNRPPSTSPSPSPPPPPSPPIPPVPRSPNSNESTSMRPSSPQPIDHFQNLQNRLNSILMQEESIKKLFKDTKACAYELEQIRKEIEASRDKN